MTLSRRTRLKFLAEVIAGQSPASEDVFPLDEGIPFIQGNAEFGRLVPTAKYECAVAPKKSLPDDILMSVRAPVGALNISNATYGIGRGLCAIRPKVGASKFYYWWLHTQKDELDSLSTGSTFSAVTSDVVGNLRVEITDPAQQQAIASHLDQETTEIDAFIADQEELIELLDERRTATIAQAVTKGLDPKVQMKDSGASWVGKMPEHWSIVPIKWKSRLVTGITPSTSEAKYYSDDEGDFQWIRPEDLDETGQASRGSKFLSPEGETQVRVLPPSTVLLCCIGATLGKVGITGRPAATNQQITAVVSSCWTAKYLFYSLQASRQDIEVLSVGNTLPILNNARLGSHLVPMPSQEEQQKIADYIDYETAEIDAAIADAKEAIELSKERRAALIAAAVTGKFDVRNHTAAELGAA